MRSSLELRHLRAFVAVAEELHFTRAAARLHLAQQALSTQIRQLEDELGTPLFHRTTRRVELTDAGRTLLLHAGPILASVNAAWQQTRRAASGELGTLSIAYTPTVAELTLPPLVAAVHERLPDVRVRTCEMWQAEMAESVDAGRFDIGLARCPVLHADLESAVLREEPLGIIARGGAPPRPGGHRSASRTSGRRSCSSGPACCRPASTTASSTPCARTASPARCRSSRTSTGTSCMGDERSQREVTAGRGFSIGFATQASRLPAGVVWRPLEPEPLIPVDMFWRPNASPVARSFVHLAREVAEAQGWLAGSVIAAD